MSEEFSRLTASRVSSRKVLYCGMDYLKIELHTLLKASTLR